MAQGQVAVELAGEDGAPLEVQAADSGPLDGATRLLAPQGGRETPLPRHGDGLPQLLQPSPHDVFHTDGFQDVQRDGVDAMPLHEGEQRVWFQSRRDSLGDDALPTSKPFRRGCLAGDRSREAEPVVNFRHSDTTLSRCSARTSGVHDWLPSIL